MRRPDPDGSAFRCLPAVLRAAAAGSLLVAGVARAGNPFSVRARVSRDSGATLLAVEFTVPAGHHLYADTLQVAAPGGVQMVPAGAATPVRARDVFSREERAVYTNDFRLAYRLSGSPPEGATVTVRYQGCSEAMCFFPQETRLPLEAAQTPGAETPLLPPGQSPRWQAAADGFRLTARAVGYMRAGEFAAFLDRALGGAGPGADEGGGFGGALRRFSDDPAAFMRRSGMFWTVLLILLGGLALNLTPCVLPLIPVNLAIIGAGAQARSRGRGFALGAAYGLAIAAVYGLLGVVGVLTGAQFGALNASPWFSLGVGALFVVLALATLDVVTIDFSRFQTRAGGPPAERRSTFVMAFFMGAVAALLAGACVAPVVLAVLVLSGTLFAQGLRAGLVLPFVLGLGMAIPWPLAGAGLSLLPKPGAWMKWVKVVLGVFILAMAAYYLRLAYLGFRGAEPAAGPPDAGVIRVTPEHAEAGWTEALARARKESRPIFVDFWATWCKSCHAMEATTFKNAAVRRRLARFVQVKYQAERPEDPAVRETLEYFGVRGLPTYVLLEPPPEGSGP